MLLAADIALVDLDQAAQRIGLVAVLHRLADLMLHQPCGRVADADLLAQLHRRDALLVVAHAIDGPEPAGERSAGLVKDRARGDRALEAANGALMHPARDHVTA